MFHRLRLSRKGQGISLNAIVIAALALVVLVVLIMVFTGRIGIFQSQIGGEAKAELQAMKALYGDCHPTAGQEGTFTAGYGDTLRDSALSETDKEQALAGHKQTLMSHVNRCNEFVSQSDCSAASPGCSWR